MRITRYLPSTVLKHLLVTPIYAGTKQLESEEQKRSVITVNLVALILSSLVLGVGSFFYTLKPSFLFLIGVPIETLAFFTVIFLNQRNQYFNANMLMLCTNAIAIGYWATVLGAGISMEILLIFYTIIFFYLSSTFFLYRKGKSFVACAIIIMLVLSWMIANIYWNLVTPLSLAPKVIIIMRWFTGAAMLVVILSILISYVTQINNLLRSAERLKDASERKSVFLREVFHEIRTPMNAIFSISQLFTLNRSTTKASTNKEIDQLFAACYLTRNIINHVLEMARIESGNFYTVKKEPILLRDCISHCIAVNSYLAASRGIQISSEIDEELTLPINSDPLILTKIFNNILSNAVKFANGNSWIEFRCTLKGGEISFSVTNEGTIDSEIAGKMFSRFFSKREQFEGTGLGLSIVKHLVNLLGGEISLDPMDRANPTKTTMVFTIPYEKGNGRPTKYSLSQFRRGCFSGAKVMVIDDDISSSELLGKLLKEMGIVPLVCTEAANIKHLVEINRPNLIISDLNMPEFSGRQVIELLRSDSEQKSIPIIIISGDAFQKDEVLTAGADAFIVKPVLVRELYLELAKHFQHHLLS